MKTRRFAALLAAFALGSAATWSVVKWHASTLPPAPTNNPATLSDPTTTAESGPSRLASAGLPATPLPESPMPAQSKEQEPRAEPVDTQVQPEFMSLLGDPNPQTRAAGLLALAKSPAPPRDAVQHAFQMTKDPNLEVGIVAANALGELHVHGHVPVDLILEEARDPSHPHKIRKGLIRGFVKRPSPKAADLMKNFLRNGSPEERRFAAGMIAYQGVDLAVPELIQALKDEDQWVRYNANEALQHVSRGRDFGEDPAQWSAWWNDYSSRTPKSPEQR